MPHIKLTPSIMCFVVNYLEMATECRLLSFQGKSRNCVPKMCKSILLLLLLYGESERRRTSAVLLGGERGVQALLSINRKCHYLPQTNFHATTPLDSQEWYFGICYSQQHIHTCRWRFVCDNSCKNCANSSMEKKGYIFVSMVVQYRRRPLFHQRLIAIWISVVDENGGEHFVCSVFCFVN